MKSKAHLIPNIAWGVAVVGAFAAGLLMSDSGQLEESREKTGKVYAGKHRSKTAERTRGLLSGKATGSTFGTRVLDESGAPLNSILADQFRSALAEHDPVRRMGLVSEMLAQMGSGDTEEILAAFSHQWRMGKYEQEFRMFLHAWGEIDGQAAVEYAMASDSPVKISRGARSAMAGWAATDLGSAKSWIEDLKPGQRRNAMVYGLLDGWSRTDLAAAAAYTETQPRSHERTQMIDLLLNRHLEQGGIGSAVDWFAGISGEGHNVTYQARAFLRISQELAREDPVAAAQWIDEHRDASYTTNEVIQNVASEWARADGAAAMDWMMGSSRENRNSFVAGILQPWSAQDSTAAGNWLREQADEPFYDVAARLHSSQVQSSDPALAMQWAESIGNEGSRTSMMNHVAQRWLQREPEAAREGLLARGMTGEQVDLLQATNSNSSFAFAELHFGQVLSRSDNHGESINRLLTVPEVTIDIPPDAGNSSFLIEGSTQLRGFRYILENGSVGYEQDE